MKVLTHCTNRQVVAQRFAVVNVSTGQILAARNMTVAGPIASIQKLLTALLIVERGNLEDIVEICPEDIPDDPTYLPMHVGLRPGERYSRRVLLECMLIASANDAALALARDCGGTVSTFVNAMNSRAVSIGMKSSVFRTPHGLPAPGQFSTVLDVAHLALTVNAVPLLRAIMAQRQVALERTDGSISTFPNTNRLFDLLDACDGMKTGFTRASGYCLVASAFSGKLRRIAIVLNSEARAVWSDARELLCWNCCDE